MKTDNTTKGNNGLKVTRLTDFSEAFVFIDATVQGDWGVSRLLQKRVRWVARVRVFLDGLQEERVPSDSLHRHHQEETQRGGVYLRPKEITGISEQNFMTETDSCYMWGLQFIQVKPSE